MAATDYQATITGTGGSVDIILDGENGVEHQYDKKVEQIIAVPKKSPSLTWVVDLARFVHLIVIKGFFEGDSSITSLTRRTTFENILKKAGPYTLSYGLGVNQEVFSGTILKGSSKASVFVDDAGDLPDGVERGFDVTFKFVEGKVKG